ncbi:MAG: hypothetical protein LBS50_10990 [Prevotellaceae bacterium]|nr:hypothetical protein [Prevotellaceae bacterium]
MGYDTIITTERILVKTGVEQYIIGNNTYILTGGLVGESSDKVIINSSMSAISFVQGEYFGNYINFPRLSILTKLKNYILIKTQTIDEQTGLPEIIDSKLAIPYYLDFVKITPLKI